MRTQREDYDSHKGTHSFSPRDEHRLIMPRLRFISKQFVPANRALNLRWTIDRLLVESNPFMDDPRKELYYENLAAAGKQDATHAF